MILSRPREDPTLVVSVFPVPANEPISGKRSLVKFIVINDWRECSWHTDYQKKVAVAQWPDADIAVLMTQVFLCNIWTGL